MEELLRQQTGYTYSLLVDNVFTAWKIAFLVNDIHEETTVLASAFAPYAYATQHHNIEYIDVTLEGSIDPRMLKKAKSSSALVLHHFTTPVNDLQQTNLCSIEDLTQMLGNVIPREHRLETAIVDFEELIQIKAAALLFDDKEKYHKASQFASKGLEAKKFWNFDVSLPAFNSILEPRFTPILHEEFQNFLSTHAVRKEKALFLNEIFSAHRLLQPTSIDECSSFLFYPLLLVPELYCPKEEIYAALIEQGLDISVHHKPIYKLKAFKEDVSLFVTEELYKSELSISLTSEHSKEDLVQIIENILEKYRFVGCSF